MPYRATPTQLFISFVAEYKHKKTRAIYDTGLPDEASGLAL
jgi:hypothetical protein